MESVPVTATCLGCGYRLRGLPRPVCSECRRQFDPDDARTFRRWSMGHRWDWLRVDPGWGHLTVVGGCTVAMLHARTEPGEVLGMFGCVSMMVAAVAVFDYIVRLVAAGMAKPRPFMATPPPPVPVYLDSEGSICQDLPCVQCGYNLRTLQPMGRCPECGTQILRSMRNRRFVRPNEAGAGETQEWRTWVGRGNGRRSR